jgi:uncharacterized protein (TIRG00374 family)
MLCQMTRYLRFLLWAIVFAVVAAVAWSHRDAIVRAGTIIARATPLWLVLAAGSTFLLYLCRAIVYSVPLRLLDYLVPWTFLWQSAIIASAINQLIPTGGASSYAFLTYALHRRGVSTGQASLIALIDTLSYACAAATLVITALVYLGVSGDLPGKVLLVGLGPGLAILALGVWTYWVQRERGRLVPVVLRVQRRLGGLLKRDVPEAPTLAFLDEYFAGKAIIARHPAAFARMVALQYLAVCADAGTLYLTFAALGLLLPPPVVFLGFIVTIAAGAIVSAPGGGGSFEVVMSAFFVQQGVETSQAIAGALLFRVVSFWLPVAVSALLLLTFRERRAEITKRWRPRLRLREKTGGPGRDPS